MKHIELTSTKVIFCLRNAVRLNGAVVKERMLHTLHD